MHAAHKAHEQYSLAFAYATFLHSSSRGHFALSLSLFRSFLFVSFLFVQWMEEQKMNKKKNGNDCDGERSFNMREDKTANTYLTKRHDDSST